MILSVGEILVDRIIKKEGEISHVGGAPFNVAVNAYRRGADVFFYGRVGKDSDGEFIKNQGEKYLPERCIIETDDERKTTVAEVTLSDGERNFKFLRDGTADYAFKTRLPFEGFPKPDIIHLGTLMLNKKQGRDFADYIVGECKQKNILLSADANFRDDLFSSRKERDEAMLPILHGADIVKFSDGEICDVTGAEGIEEAIKEFNPKGYIFVTCGKEGSVAWHRDTGYVYCEATPAEKVVDTTGAGDAYFGTVLALLDELLRKGNAICRDTLRQIMAEGNEAGKRATQKEGAV